MRNFRYYLRVRSGECDGQKVVFNARYRDYIGLATFEYLRAAGLSREFSAKGLSCQLVNQSVVWKAPARFDQVLELSVRVSHAESTSFAVSTEMRNVDEGRLCALAETVFTMVEEAALRTVLLTERQRALLLGSAGAQIVDHAGYLPSHGCTVCAYELPMCM